MKALIIAAAGFVGRHLVNELLGSKWDVSGTRLPTETADLDIPVYGLDILDIKAVKNLIKKVNPDCIIHLAAQSSVAISWKQPALTVDVNVKGVINLLEAVRDAEKPPRLLLIGSGEEYGFVSPEDIPVSEETTLKPGNIYAGTKIAQGIFGQIYAEAYGLEVIIIRAFNHIGPGQTDAFVIPAFCKQVAEIEVKGKKGVIRVGNLEAKRDFTDVRDIVRAYRLLAEKGKSGEIYNIGSGVSVSIADVLDKIIGLSKADITIEQDPARLRPSDVPDIRADISKLTACTGWKPEITLDVTLKDVLEEWRREKING